MENVSIERAPFGRLADGRAVSRYALRSPAGVEVHVSPYGGALLSVVAPDRAGRPGDVVLGFDGVEAYVADRGYFGALVGRHANRIRGGRFVLDGAEVRLPVNDGPNHLHGGPRGFHKVLWEAEEVRTDDGAGVALRYDSPDGDEGYPGALSVRVTYLLTDGGDLVVDYEAETDRPTVVNLTQHTYFNLSGDASRDVLGHVLRLDADRFTPVDATLIPTGELAPVEGTPFDFRVATAIGARIGDADARLAGAGGYDHNFVLNGGGGLSLAAEVREPESGRTLALWTTEPGMQFYSGNYLDGSVTGKGGVAYGHRSGFCLEPQHFPDSPNQPSFPSVVLRPGERFTSRTMYRFGVD